MFTELFVRSIRCPVCSHANDVDVWFCQRCACERKVAHFQRPCLLTLSNSMNGCVGYSKFWCKHCKISNLRSGILFFRRDVD